jgi:acetylornithine/succinyldiaminopimelate/putrescine aminotransferase
VNVAVLTVSDRVSRGEAEDGSGDLLEQLLREDAFDVQRRLVPDERDEIAAALRERGFLVNAITPTALRLVPALCLARGEADAFCDALADVLGQVHTRLHDYAT